MDRTKRQAKAAREQQQQQQQQHVVDVPTDGEVQDLEELVLHTRERVKAAKAAKLRAATLRRELQDLQEEEQSFAAYDEVDPAPLPVPVPNADPSSFVAATLKSAVILIFT